MTRRWGLAALAAALLLGMSPAAPAQAKPAGAPLLWLPAEPFRDWEPLSRLLRNYDRLKLTIALSPEQVSPECEAALSPWIAAGRLEVALRLSGDPVLPLIERNEAAPRPQDVPNRLAVSRERFQLQFGAPPAGFSPAAGAVDAAQLPVIKSMGLGWVAVGDYAAGSDSWAASSGVVLVPTRALAPSAEASSPETAPPTELPASSALALDEADGLLAPGSGMRWLSRLAGEHPRGDWATVSEAVRASALRDAAPGESWPAWLDSAATWSSSDTSRRAWQIYAEAALSLDRYQNSGTADLKALEDATEELYGAQANRFFRASPLAGEAPGAADREFRKRLAALYRKLKQPPPESLPEEPGPPGSPASPEVRVAKGASWLSFDNPAGSLSRPVSTAAAATADYWKIAGLRVEWTSENVTLVYRLARLGPAQGGLGPLLLDTYIDINHVVGAGSTALLPGRRAFASARDAWEFAVTASGSGAFLYRSDSTGEPRPLGAVELTLDPAKAQARVRIPRSLLRGSPLRWGYIVAALAVDPAAASPAPFAPLADESGATLRALLAPLDAQQAALKGSGPQRLGALRADDAGR